MKKTLQTIKKAGIYFLFFGVSMMSAQTTYTFTSAGATAQVGPTAPQITAAYLATNLNGSVTVTGGIQQFTIPTTGPYRITAIGAKGGFNGGSPASISGDFTLTAGTVLKVLVGQTGTTANNGSNEAGGGGGGSFVTNVANVPYLVAGGGGGNATGYDGLLVPVPCCLNGMQATLISNGNPYPGGANGGTLLNGGTCSGWTAGGGAGFNGNGSLCDAGTTAFSFINGGVGGNGNNLVGHGGFGGGGGGSNSGSGQRGGGGGGYSGGGGGVANFNGYDKAGGGGGSYNSGANQTNSIIASVGSGTVLITSLYSVNISQTATISCNGNTTAALSTTVSGGVGPFTYTWAPTGGNAATATALAAGVYTCFVKDAGLNLTAKTFTVTQPAQVVSTVVSQTNVTCNAGSNGAITLTTTGGTAPYSYTWSPTGGSVATASGLVANTYSCIVKDANLCSANSPSATITQPASFSITATVTNSLICGAGSTTFTASGASTYTWTGGVTNGATFTPTVSNSYTVTAKNGAGCLASNSPVITVNVGSIPTVSVTSGTICSGQSFTMVASGASTYMYTGGSAVVTPTANMSYSVTGTSSIGCLSSNTAVSTVTVNVNPTISASASSAIICAGEATTLSATASSTTYTWNTGATTVSLSVSPTTTTNYTVTTTGTNGCTAAANVNVTVNACVGINEAVASLISVYPNPNNGVVNINLTAELAKNASLEVYDALGKLVVKQVLANELNIINVSNLDNGIYMFKVLNNTNTVKIGKLIKH